MLCRFMHRFGSWLVLLVLATPALWAQPTVPTLSQPLPNQTVALGGSAVTVDLRNYFTIPGVTGQVAQFDTVLGKINVELLGNDTPLTVANFLNYVNRGAYTNSIIHRSAKLSDNVTPFVIQGGGFALQGNSIGAIAADAPVKNEFKISNTRGTMAMAKTAAGPDTATNQWFFNLGDNSANLDNQNGGFTVFARVIGTGMTVVDAIAAVPSYDASGANLLNDSNFTALPLLNPSLTAANLVLINSIATVPIYPASGASTSVLSFAGQSFNSSIASVKFDQSNLVITPSSTATGTATISVTASDTNGNVITGSFTVTVAASVAAPVITTPPASQYVTPGSNVTFSVVASGTPPLTYQWKLNGAAIAGATGATYTIVSAQFADAGIYTVTVTNSVNAITSNAAVLTVNPVVTPTASRITSLSIRIGAGTGDQTLIAGFQVSGNGKSLLIRGVGPTLANYSVPGFLVDPLLSLFNGNPTLINSNDNWSDAANASQIAATAAQLQDFALPAGSKDAALLATLNDGLYTAQVSGVGNTTGIALVEVYDANPTAASRLTGVSARTQVGTGANILIAGFAITGTAQMKVLLRGVGPTLASFAVNGVLADPQIAVYTSPGGFQIASNDNWSDNANAAQISANSGFPLPAGSKDAALLLTLNPGTYTVQVSGVGNATGVALVEVYEVP
jgi:cyclophilin family peptidyl-prolyl cis-trans isomerase